jgi:hypothetical protein
MHKSFKDIDKNAMKIAAALLVGATALGTGLVYILHCGGGL